MINDVIKIINNKPDICGVNLAIQLLDVVKTNMIKKDEVFRKDIISRYQSLIIKDMRRVTLIG